METRLSNTITNSNDSTNNYLTTKNQATKTPHVKDFIKTYVCDITNAIARFDKTESIIDEITDTYSKIVTTSRNTYTFSIPYLHAFDDKIQKKLTGSAIALNIHKLFSYGIAELCRTNHFDRTEKELEIHEKSINYCVRIPVSDYAEMTGHDVIEHVSNSIDDADKEKVRVATNVRQAKARLTDTIMILNLLQVTWKDKNRKGRDYNSISLFEKCYMDRNYIIMDFGKIFVREYLLISPIITWYPMSLLKIDNRNPNAYMMGMKIIEHYCIIMNQINETQNRLMVSTLLKCMNLPTIDEVRQNRHSWKNQIKEPFKRALDYLCYTLGLLSHWQYVKEKGLPLSNAEVAEIIDYEAFSELFVEFYIMNPPDLTQLIAKKRAEITAARQSKKFKKTKDDGTSKEVDKDAVKQSFE